MIPPTSIISKSDAKIMKEALCIEMREWERWHKENMSTDEKKQDDVDGIYLARLQDINECMKMVLRCVKQ